MNWIKVAKNLEGLHTAQTISSQLGIGRQTTLNYIHALKKKGLLKTSRSGYGRLYTIRPYNLRTIGYDGLYETINKNSPIKLVIPYYHRIVDHELSLEEAIIRSLVENKFRLVLASLYLFTKIENWKLLYKLSKENNIERQVGALYELSSRLFKVKEADKKILEKMKKSKVKSKFIIDPIKTDDFKDIEKKWDVYIPFNRADLERYEEAGIKFIK